MSEQAATRRVPRGGGGSQGVWSWLFESTLGTVFKFIGWSLSALAFSVLIEWIGLVYWWGPDHSQQVLDLEMSYLGEYNKNLITGLYPADIAESLMDKAEVVIGFLHLRELSAVLADGISQSVGTIASYGIESLINVIFIFAVRSAICLSAATGFILVCLVALIDGLVERDIRRACGGIESAMVYHRAKRTIVPLLFLSVGGYLTAPVSVHPTYVFLPVMFFSGLAIYLTAKSFKKFL